MKSKSLLIIVLTSLLFFAVNKDYTVGTDSYNYYQSFVDPYYFENQAWFSGIQKFWFYIVVFLHNITNYIGYQLFCYSIIIGGIGYMIYKASSNYSFSCLLFYLLYFYFASYNITRQYIAIGIVCIGIICLINNNKIKYFVLIIIASLFHFSALFSLIFVFFKCLNLKNKTIVIGTVLFSFIIGFFFNEILISVVSYIDMFSNLSGKSLNSYVEIWGGERNISTNLIINAFFLITYLLSKRKHDFFLNSYFLFIILSNLLASGGAGNRIFIYLQISMIIVIPNVYNDLKRSDLKFFYLLFALIFSYGYWYFSISSNAAEVVPYSFF